MKPGYIKAVLFILLFAAISYPANAQLKNVPIKLGLNFSALNPQNEFHGGGGLKWSTYTRGFLRIGLSEKLEGEVGGGYMKYAGLDRLHNFYSTNIYPIDLRLVYSPFDFDSWNPYVSAGFGLVYWTKKNPPIERSPLRLDTDGFTRIIPLTLGAEFELTKELFFNLNLGYTHSFTSGLNGYKAENSFLKNDGAFNLGAGLTLALNPVSKDKDMDGLTKNEERKLGTDPENPDTDQDGLTDGEEVLTFKTDPLKTDTDEDGLSDSEELNSYKTDPLTVDSDNDNLSDGDEVLKYKTSPVMFDTDGDRLSDVDEVLKNKTNPLLADTDKDGLSDLDEIQKYKTNPLLADTDQGGKSDAEEVKAGTNPLSREDDVEKPAPVVEPVKEEVFSLDGILFNTNSAAITSEAEVVLEKNMEYLSKHQDLKIQVIGHTDNTGNLSYNMKLSEKRAESVKNWLTKKGIPAERITTLGLGPKEPAADNKAMDGRKKNRRAEFKKAGM